MAIRSGIGARLFLDAYDLSGDVGSIGQISGSINLQDTTVLQDKAMRRLALLRDGQIAFSAFYDGATGASQPVLDALPGNPTQCTVLTGTGVGYDTFSLRGLQATFDDVRGQDGSLVLNTSLMASVTGLDVGELLTTGLQTFGSTGSGSVLTYGHTGTAFGLAAYLHATSLTSGTATVAIQSSSDNISYANVTGGVFTAITGATSQRIQTALNVSIPKYLKLHLTGTFSTLKVAVTVIRFTSAKH